MSSGCSRSGRCPTRVDDDVDAVGRGTRGPARRGKLESANKHPRSPTSSSSSMDSATSIYKLAFIYSHKKSFLYRRELYENTYIVKPLFVPPDSRHFIFISLDNTSRQRTTKLTAEKKNERLSQKLQFRYPSSALCCCYVS